MDLLSFMKNKEDKVKQDKKKVNAHRLDTEAAFIPAKRVVHQPNHHKTPKQ